MAEDSGAFKTILQIRARFRHIVAIRATRCRDAALLKKQRPQMRRSLEPPIFNNLT
jgi:hypothetical protein